MHTPYLDATRGAACWVRAMPAGALTRGPRWVATRRGGSAAPMDLLACGTSEQWRARVGQLWAIPYQEHAPEALPTADARLVALATWRAPSSAPRDRAEFGAAERDDPAVVACFPVQYALPDMPAGQRCVPEAALPLVRRRSCHHGAVGERRKGFGCVTRATWVACSNNGIRGDGES